MTGQFAVAGAVQFGIYGSGQQAAHAGDAVFHASAETAACQYRAPLGSFVRFCGILIEHFAAAFPLWLAPEQIRILTVSEKFGEYGNAVLQKLQAVGLRASLAILD